MLAAFKYAIVGMILGVVLFGLVDPVCQQTIFSDTLGGLLVGIFHGTLHVFCILEKGGSSFTLRRAKFILVSDVKIDMIIGLMIGSFKALFKLCV
jgi:hypothetical protein